MKKISKFLSILVLALVIGFSFSLTGCTKKTDDQTPGTEDNTQDYTIEVLTTTNGTVTTDISTAKKGDVVNVTVEPDFGYKLKEGSLKANDIVITDNKFVMPEANVKVSAEFVADADELTVVPTNLEINSLSGQENAKAYISTTFDAEVLKVKYVVSDSILVVRKDGKVDGIKLYLSQAVKSEAYLENKTYLVEAYTNDVTKVLVYNGTEFVESNVNITVDFNLFTVDSKLDGYVVEVSVPYSVWNLTKEEAKGELTMLPMLYNNNTTSPIISAKGECPIGYSLDVNNHNTFMILEDDNTYCINSNLFPGHYFKNTGTIVVNGTGWDLTNDTETSSGDVVLRANDNDNLLAFNVSSTEFMYAKTTIKLNGFLNPDRFPKFGIALYDGSNENGTFFYIDLETQENNNSELSHIVGNNYGLVYRENSDWNKYTQVGSKATFDLSTMTVVMEAIYIDGMLYFLADGVLVSSGYYQALTDKLVFAITGFNLAVTLSDYYCTEDINDSKIADTLAKIDTNVVADDYGNEIIGNLNNDVNLKYGAIYKDGKTYLKATLTTNNLPASQKDGHGWWTWTNFEFAVDGKQLYVSIASNMSNVEGAFHAYVGSDPNRLFTNDILGVKATVVKTQDEKYETTVYLLIDGLENSLINVAYCVAGGTEGGVSDGSSYAITNLGLVKHVIVTEKGHIFKNNGLIVANGGGWNIDGDTAEASGDVVLTQNDGDNHLVFNASSKTFMYAKATIKLDGFLAPEAFPKFGIALLDGSANHGTFFYIDAGTSGGNTELSHIVGNGFGTNFIDNGWTKWVGLDSTSMKFNLETKTITLEAIYENGMLYFFADGVLVHTAYYNATTEDLAFSLKVFNLGVTVSDYYCTTEKGDSKVANAIAQINTNVVLDDYGYEVVTQVRNTNVDVKYSAINKEEGTYIKAVFNTPNLPTSQGAVNGWWDWTNFEFDVNGKQLYVSIAANMNDVNNPYHVFVGSRPNEITSKDVLGLKASIIKTNDNRYEITVHILVEKVQDNSQFKLNFCVINGVREGLVNDSLYAVTANGLVA